MTAAPGPDVPLTDLDFEKIGRALVMLVPTCVHLRHASIESTLYYVHPESGTEAEFVHDLFMLPLEEVITKWYGGREPASRLAAAVMDQILADLIPG